MANQQWLPGYAWPVHRAHAEFLRFNYFDGGSLFHSDVRAHGERWQEPDYSVLVQQSAGSASQSAAAQNAASALLCEVTDWAGRTSRRLTATNGDLVALLRSGDMAAFLRGAREG